MRLAYLSLVLAISAMAAKPALSLGNPLWGNTWTVGDFDGDGQPDLVTTRPDGYGSRGFRNRVELHLSSRTGASLSFPVYGRDFGISVTARDVDGDHDLDLVITSVGSHQPVGVWINNGSGNFEEGAAEAYPASIWLDSGPGIYVASTVHPDLIYTLEQRRTAFGLPATVLTEQTQPDEPGFAPVCFPVCPSGFFQAAPRAPPLAR